MRPWFHRNVLGRQQTLPERMAFGSQVIGAILPDGVATLDEVAHVHHLAKDGYELTDITQSGVVVDTNSFTKRHIYTSTST